MVLNYYIEKSRTLMVKYTSNGAYSMFF